jgi:predicted transcriptional regulator of viral defense system
LSAGLDLLETTLPQIEVERLVGYALQYQVGAVIKRLGWCLETLGISGDLLGLLQQVPMNNVSLLDPRMPACATVNDHWQVNENIMNP